MNMQLNVLLDDLSDEGLDILLSKILLKDETYINNWAELGQLLEDFKVSITYLPDSNEWEAYIVDEEIDYLTAKSPCVAVVKTILRQQILRDYNNDYGLRLPKSSLKEMLNSAYWDSELNTTLFQNEIMLNETDLQIQELEGKYVDNSMIELNPKVKLFVKVI